MGATLAMFGGACQSGGNEEALEAARQAKQEAKEAKAQAEKAQEKAQEAEAKLAAFKRDDKKDDEGQSAEPAVEAPSAASADVSPNANQAGEAPAPEATEPGVYSLASVQALPEDCTSPSVMLAAVSNNVSKKDDFAWAYPVQALFAHPEFVLVNKVRLTAKNRVAVQEVQVTPKVVGLVAYCHDADTCNRLGAMYQTTVPTAKPELYCGKKWEPGKIPRGLLNAVDLKATAWKKLKSEPTSMCARIGVCMKQQNPATPGDPGIECQKQPTKHKYKCGQEKTCEQVVSCASR